jgi:hypothetical protein
MEKNVTSPELPHGKKYVTSPDNFKTSIRDVESSVSNSIAGGEGSSTLIASVVMMKITDQLGTPRGRYDEHISKFPSVRNQGFIVQEKVNTPEGDAC